MKQRITELVKLIVSQTNFITIHQLSKQMRVSERTIHNYISSQDFAILISPLSLEKVPNKGVKLSTDRLTKVKILARLKDNVSLNYEQEDDFCKIMILLLSKDKISFDVLCQNLYLSSSTLQVLLTQMEDYAKKHNCSIQQKRGISITGNEIHIRKLYYAFFTSFRHQKQARKMEQPRLSDKTKSILNILLAEEEYLKLIHILHISEKMINTNYCDEDYNKLIIQMSIMILRTRLGFHIQQDQFYNINNSQEFYYALLMKEYLEKDFELALHEEEIKYLAVLLIGTRKQVNIANTNYDMDVLEKFINLLSIRLNVELSNDFELKQNLISHLRPAINRMKHGVTSVNPLLEQIRINYTEIYMAVITTIEDLEIMENIHFDSNEIGYVCLHIIAAVNRPSNLKRVQTALICNEGLSIEIFLKNIIESYFGEILICEIFRENNIQQMNINEYNLIINSSTQIVQAKNVINIDTNFTHKDHSSIRHFLLCHTTIDTPVSEDSYTNHLMFFHDTVNNQQELLRKYCNFLKKNGNVKTGFYDSVLSRTNISSTYIARGIALPHGAKDEVLSSTILIINLSKPIKWDDEEADLIILAAANDNDTGNYNFLFRKIMKIASSDEYSTQFKTCRSLQELHQILERV